MISTLLLTVTLGITQTLLGPGLLPDSPVVSYGNHFYISNRATYRFDAAWQPLGVVLTGSPGSFDDCGAWLQSVYQDGPILRAWYHAETECDYNNNLQTHKSMAYAESYDGGQTFVKKGQIITAPPIPDALYDDEGDFSVVINGDYFYLYFLTTRDRRVHLARSLISDGGKPGTWVKWYQGSFSQPGLGGESDPLGWQWEIQKPWVRWNSYLQRYIAVSRRHGGYALSLSRDGIHWTGTDCLLIENAGMQWEGRDTAPLMLTEYENFVGDGPAIDLYFMLIPAYQGYSQRYLMRRRVTFEALRQAQDDMPGGGCSVQTGEAVQPGRVEGAWLPVVVNQD